MENQELWDQLLIEELNKLPENCTPDCGCTSDEDCYLFSEF
jgi:hypothetical protein